MLCHDGLTWVCYSMTDWQGYYRSFPSWERGENEMKEGKIVLSPEKHLSTKTKQNLRVQDKKLCPSERIHKPRLPLREPALSGRFREGPMCFWMCRSVLSSFWSWEKQRKRNEGRGTRKGTAVTKRAARHRGLWIEGCCPGHGVGILQRWLIWISQGLSTDFTPPQEALGPVGEEGLLCFSVHSNTRSG